MSGKSRCNRLASFMSCVIVLGLMGAPWVVNAADDETKSADKPSCSTGTDVTTHKGKVCGTSKHGVISYSGIPYAAPPTGDLRWEPPQPHEPWEGTFQATRLGNRCPRPDHPDMTKHKTSEDCLVLKVQKPEHAKSKDNLPVVVEMHGGGFLGEALTNNGENMVRHNDVIYVYPGYRLGVLGFLAHESLGKHAGNYGLQDQQAALTWVQKNIDQFGGDPDNVTIVGESAGGSSVCNQIASPTAKGLFQKGISVSGFYNYNINDIWSRADCKAQYYTEEQAQKIGEKFARKVGCSDADDVAACLRKVPVDKLLQTGGQFVDPKQGGTIGPIVDGKTITRSPAEAFASGKVNDVKVIMDVGRDEFNGGMYKNRKNRPTIVAENKSQYRELIKKQFGDQAQEVMDKYPLSAFPDPAPFLAYRTVMADAFSVCPMMNASRHLSRHIPVYAELFSDSDTPGESVNQPLGAYHSGANRLIHASTDDLDHNQQVLQSEILDLWGGFAREGNPSADYTPTWTTFNKKDHAVKTLDASGNSRLVPASQIRQAHHCDFWDQDTLVRRQAEDMSR